MLLVEPDERVRLALQHPGRAAVLQACIASPASARMIEARTGIPTVTCYRHIRTLVDHGLLVVARAALSPEGRPYDLYESTVAVAQLRVDADGVHATSVGRARMKDRLHGLWKQLEDR